VNVERFRPKCVVTHDDPGLAALESSSPFPCPGPLSLYSQDESFFNLQDDSKGKDRRESPFHPTSIRVPLQQRSSHVQTRKIAVSTTLTQSAAHTRGNPFCQKRMALIKIRTIESPARFGEKDHFQGMNHIEGRVIIRCPPPPQSLITIFKRNFIFYFGPTMFLGRLTFSP
jgi:hypothetical protein